MMSQFNEKRQVRNSISRYFGNVLMTKTKEQGTYSFYYAKVGCLLCIENRYLVAIVHNDSKLMGYSTYLSDLDWISFQTRTFEKTEFKIKPQQINSVYALENIVLEKLSEEKDRTIYVSYDVPIQVELLKDEENDKHSNKGTLKAALDSYNCVVLFTM